MNIQKPLIYFLGLTLAGCGSLSQDRIDAKANAMRQQIESQRAQANSSSESHPLVEKMHGTYLSSATIPLAYAASLPAIFRAQATMNFRARPGTKLNLTTISARFTEATTIPVRIRPDVYISAKSLVRSADSGSNKNEAGAGPNGQQPMMPSPSAAPGNPNIGAGKAAVSAQFFADFEDNLPQEFDGGTWAQYLDTICAHMGINWEYKDNGVVLYRLTTKSFVIKVNPGDTKFSSSVSKGGGAASTGGTGSGGSAGGSSAGSFTSDTSSSVSASASVWKAMESAVNGMRSPLGTVTVDQAAGLVTVTDTKDSIEQIGRYINTMNATLTRQIELEVRVLQVATTENNSAGFDVNVIYSKIGAAGNVDSQFGITSPKSIGSTDSGKLSFGVLSPTNSWTGSSIVVQALKDIGTIVSDQTKTSQTTNRVPVSIANFSTETYLAATTPAAGSAYAGGGSGVPGLTPGTLTTGNFLNVIPTAFEDGSVLLRIAIDDTTSQGIGTISSGNGATFQQIQTPKYSGSKSDHSAGLRNGESLVLVGTTQDVTNGSNRSGISGYSANGTHTRQVQIVIVTPHVRAGI